jgi:hypothetical protein
MFRQLASALPVTGTERRQLIFEHHPFELAAVLEAGFEEGRNFPPDFDAGAVVTKDEESLGHPNHRSDVATIGVDGLTLSDDLKAAMKARVRHRWPHLIYAYMTMNTRIYEIFRRVLYELLHGEKLGTPLPDAQRWLRTTEELFYKQSSPFLTNSVISDLRQDRSSTARNAFHRMFGMDLNHGGEDGQPYPYVKAAAANTEFVATFEELLREVWVGMTYVTATSSSNPTDDARISELATKLHDMLLSRRQHGNLAREEFALVAMMSWFHMTIEFNSPIVMSLRAEATGVEQRLFKIAERVGLPAHGLSKNFLKIADPMSLLLIEIEKGRYNSANAASALYSRTVGGATNPIAPVVGTIINHWTAITGRDVKARKVSSS